MDDKLTALDLKGALLASNEQILEAFKLRLGVLTELGESIPSTVTAQSLDEKVLIALQHVSCLKNDVMSLKIVQADDPAAQLAKYYNHAAKFSYFFDPLMQNLLVSQAIISDSQKGWSKFSCYPLSLFSAYLATKGYISESLVVGRAALKLLERFDDADDQRPYVFG